jgi:O-antigen biosynthesis protein
LNNSNSAEHRHPYYVVAPDYRETSAGVRVMHRLCHMLNTQGQEAYIAGAQIFHPDLLTPVLDDETTAKHRAKGLIPIAIYSDIVTGNPLRAPVCVRYMLNKEGVIEGNAINAGPDDLFFYYSPAFTPDTQGKFDLLRLHTHDLDLFKPDPERTKTGPLLYLNRIPPSAIDFSLLPEDIEVLSNQNPLSLAELARKLQSATALYSYESSATCTLAMLCGCPLVALTLPGYEQLGFSSQALSIYAGRGYALTNTEEDLQAARDGLPLIRQYLLYVAQQVGTEIAAFIDKTQQKAHEIARNPPPSLLHHNAYQNWIAIQRHAKYISGREEISPRLTKLPSFHLVVVDDGKAPQQLARTLRSLAGQQYPRVFVTVTSPLSAPENSNSQRLEWLQGKHVWESAALALRKAGPDVWVSLVVAGDALACHSLQAIAGHLDAYPQLQAIYTDEDIIEDYGTRHSPRFKPDFDPRLLQESGYIGGLLLAKNEVWQAAGGWRHSPGHDDEFDLALRLAGVTPAESFGHIADVLYHSSPTWLRTRAPGGAARTRRTTDLHPDSYPRSVACSATLHRNPVCTDAGHAL